MTQIKSLAALTALRDKYKSDIDFDHAPSNDSKVRITIGMATCGVAAGGKETMNAMAEEVQKQSLHQVALVQTGCMGACFAEPVVEVLIPGQKPVLYGKIDANKGREIILKHIKNGEIQSQWMLREGY